MLSSLFPTNEDSSDDAEPVIDATETVLNTSMEEDKGNKENASESEKTALTEPVEPKKKKPDDEPDEDDYFMPDFDDFNGVNY